jgi:hypothetical protein
VPRQSSGSPASTCRSCSERQARARAIGYALHFLFGFVFASVYYLVFSALGEASWWLGALFGGVHAAFAGTALVNILLPLIHPRMGTSFSSASSAPLLEPPGFMLLNYGWATPAVMLVSHVIYGTIVGAGAHG